MIMRGEVAWAKVLGAPAKGFEENTREWSIDFKPNDPSRAKYLKEGGSDFYLKSKEKHPLGEFIAFKRNEVKKDGTPAKPITVVDKDGNPWDSTVRIGNGSVVDVKVALNEVSVGRQKRLKPSLIAIRVIEHVPYEGKGDSSDFEDFDYTSNDIDDTPWA